MNDSFARQEAQAAYPRQYADGPRPIIVLVDDNKEARTLLARMLEKEGYAVLTSANPYEVLMLLEAVPASLLVADVLMSGMTGLNLTRQVRSSPGIAWLPILVFSASDSRDEAFDAGADGFIDKDQMDWPVFRDAVAGLIGPGTRAGQRETASARTPALAAV